MDTLRQWDVSCGRAITELNRARNDQAEVARLNEPTRLENLQRRERNAPILRANTRIKKLNRRRVRVGKKRLRFKRVERLLRMPFQISARSQRVFDREEETRLRLATRPPEQWRALLDLIPKKAARVAAACVIWWDYFSSHEVADRWPHLDEFLPFADWRDVPNAVLEQTLYACGYSAVQARARSAEKAADFTPNVPNELTEEAA